MDKKATQVFVIANASDYHDTVIEIEGVFSSYELALKFAEDNELELNDKDNEHWYEITPYSLDNKCQRCCNEGLKSRDNKKCPFDDDVHEVIKYCNCCDNCRQECREDI